MIFHVSSSYCKCLSCSGNCEDVKAPERYFCNLWSIVHALQKLGVISLPKLNRKGHNKFVAFRKIKYSNETNTNVNFPWHLHAAQDTETWGKWGRTWLKLIPHGRFYRNVGVKHAVSVPDRILLYSTFTKHLRLKKKKAPNNENGVQNNGRCTPSAIQKRKKKCCCSGTFNEVEMLGCGLCPIKCDHYCLHCEELDETAVQNASLHGSYCFVLYLLAS